LPHILKFYKRIEKKRPVMLLDLQNQEISAYSYKEINANTRPLNRSRHRPRTPRNAQCGHRKLRSVVLDRCYKGRVHEDADCGSSC